MKFGKALLFVILLSALQVHAEIQTQEVIYPFNGVKLHGFLALDTSTREKRPGILVVHEWWGLNQYAKDRAMQLAKLGYVAFAADMYGEGRHTEHPKEAGEWSAAVSKDVELQVGRAKAGLQVLKQNSAVDPSRMAAIGYCFGGATVLRLAFSGEPLSIVASFHGSLPIPDDASKTKAPFLIMHGADDSFVPPETIKNFRAKLDEAKVRYDFISYPGAKHGFTVPEAGTHGLEGLAYNAGADKKSWQVMLEHFKKAFAA